VTLGVWQNFFHMAGYSFCAPGIRCVGVLHIRFEEVPIIDARVTSLQT